VIVVVMGVSGSGKSTVGAAIADAVGWPFVDGDSLHPAANVEKMAHGHPLTNADRAPWLDAIGEAMDKFIRDGADAVIACSALKRVYRDRLRDGRPDVWFAFLDIHTDLLKARMAQRHGHFMPSTLLPSQLATLERPAPDELAVTVRVDRETTPAETAARVVAALEAAWRMDRVIESALSRLDLAGKVRLLAGQDMWTLPAAPEIGLRSIVMSDGPIGVRGVQWTAGDPAVALPSATALASTWDPALARRAGQLLGQEARRKGVDVLLAPTVNLHRSPLGGRHFEAYSEDPRLTGAIGAGYVAGVQEHGVAVTVKHFTANDSETDRFTVDVIIDERTLRELYLAPFRAVVDAGAWGVMAAYNGVNGASMTENAPLQIDVLKREWGFDGVIVSDWLAARDTRAAAVGGLDIAMPSANNPWGDALVEAVHTGAVPPEVIDDKVRRVLRLAIRVGAMPGPVDDEATASIPPAVDGAAFARELAARSFVLAANPGRVLPLDSSAVSRVAVIGALARDARVMGGGSAQVFPERVVSPLEGLEEALEDGVVTYALGADPRRTLPAIADARVALLDGSDRELWSEPRPYAEIKMIEPPPGVAAADVASVSVTASVTAQVSGTHEISILGVGAYTLAVGDDIVFDDFIPPDSNDFAAAFLQPPERRFPVALDAGQTVEVRLRQNGVVTEPLFVVGVTLGHAEPRAGDDEMLDEAARLAAGADVAIVVVGTTSEVESEGFDRTSLALPGRQDELVRRVAAANPRTVVVVNAGSPVELPWADDVAAVLLSWFPGQEAGHALADVLLGAVEPGGRLPTTWPRQLADAPVTDTTPVDGRLEYSEGLLIGYRAWERHGATPRWWFGHGLGYTDWAYANLTIEADSMTASLDVTNTGDRAGREIVQLYVADDRAPADRPKRWLAGFAQVTAEPGETVRVWIPVPARAFDVWDGGWRRKPGTYRIEVGRSVDAIEVAAELTV
jgi:beta-glucosidase